MSLPVAKSDSPTKYLNSEGLGVRLQCFLTVRDDDRRVACVRLKDFEGKWTLPGETLKPNEAPADAAKRVADMWFGQALDARLVDVISYPDDGDNKWYLLFLYEAPLPKEGLQKLPDTDEIAFAPVDKAPGEWAMSHADVFARLPQ